MNLHAEKFPDDAGLINITQPPFNANGNDNIDDTQAIKDAIIAHLGTGRIIYFPNGTYIISDTLEWRRLENVGTAEAPIIKPVWRANLSFQGESREGTILKLADYQPGFTTPPGQAPPPAKPMIATGSTLNDRANQSASGGGNEAFRNSFYDMTLDAGSGNDRAIGIDWAVSNRGVIRNVTIRSVGAGRLGQAGVALTREPGPSLMQNVLIDGFTTAILGGSHQYSSTFHKVTLNNQNGVGVVVGPGTYNFEELRSNIPAGSTNTEPVILIKSGTGQLTVINSSFARGTSSPSICAIEDLTTSGPNPVAKFFLRNVTTAGYASALKIDRVIQPGNNIAERSSHPALKSFTDDAVTSLNLPIEQPPAVFTSTNSDDWANVNNYSNGGLAAARAGDTVDDTVAIQNAMRSNRKIVYFPKAGTGNDAYLVSGTIDIPDTVERVTLGENRLRENRARGIIPAASGVFRVVGGAAAPPLVIERFWSVEIFQNRPPIILNTSGRVVYIRDVSIGGYDAADNRTIAYRNSGGTGKLFVDNAFATLRLDTPQQAWCRQLNSEYKDAGNTNVGGSLWVLGLKTEGDFTAITTTNGSTELLGGFLMPGVYTDDATPSRTAFIGNNSRQSLTFQTWTRAIGDFPPIYVQETRGIQSGEVRLDEVPLIDPALETWSRSWVPLYVGYPADEALMVVGTVSPLSPIDVAVKSRLENNLGFSVTVVDDAASTAHSAAGKAVVFISPSAAVADLGSKFRDIPEPIVCSKAFSFANMGMSTLAQNGQGIHSALSIVTPEHPLAAGLSAGPQTVLNAAVTVGVGRPAPGGIGIATLTANSTHFGVFGYERMTPMVSPHFTRERKVGFFLAGTANNLTAKGWSLFDAAINWAAE